MKGPLGWFAWGILYVLLMLCLGGLMWQVRNWALNQGSSPEAQQAWDEWRAAVAKQQREPGPVSRRMPKSSEPPLTVLMREQFATCVFGIWMLATAVFVTLSFMIRGVLFSPAPIVHKD